MRNLAAKSETIPHLLSFLLEFFRQILIFFMSTQITLKKLNLHLIFTFFNFIFF